jgi:ribosome biogenesis SPOUT family RNA methylase Rps3
MTTDTAVRVTRLVVQEKSGLKRSVLKIQQFIFSVVPLDKIPYVDYPELRVNKNESTEMPFRYVKGENGESIMPEVSQNCGPIITLKMFPTDGDEGND